MNEFPIGEHRGILLALAVARASELEAQRQAVMGAVNSAVRVAAQERGVELPETVDVTVQGGGVVVRWKEGEKGREGDFGEASAELSRALSRAEGETGRGGER